MPTSDFVTKAGRTCATERAPVCSYINVRDRLGSIIFAHAWDEYVPLYCLLTEPGLRRCVGHGSRRVYIYEITRAWAVVDLATVLWVCSCLLFVHV